MHLLPLPDAPPLFSLACTCDAFTNFPVFTLFRTNEQHQNPLFYALELKNAEMAAVLRSYRGYHQRICRHLDQAKTLQTTLAQKLADSNSKLQTEPAAAAGGAASKITKVRVASQQCPSRAHMC